MSRPGVHVEGTDIYPAAIEHGGLGVKAINDIGIETIGVVDEMPLRCGVGPEFEEFDAFAKQGAPLFRVSGEDEFAVG